MKFQQLVFSFLMLFAVATFNACSKNDNQVVPAPEIADSGLIDNRVSITVGEELTLHPQSSIKGNYSYRWLVDGTEKGTDSVYKFTAADRGEYAVQFIMSNTSGEVSITYNIRVLGKYENGFFIANEGWFGTEPSSVNFYRYGADTLEQNIYAKENPGKNIGAPASNLQFATIHDGKLYLVNKVGGPVVVTDAYSLKETVRSVNGNWQAFTPLDNDKGLLTSTTGIHPVDLATMTAGSAIPGTKGAIGDIMKAGNHIFAIASVGALILNASDYSVLDTIMGVRVGFSQTPDGRVWCASAGGYVFSIDPQTLDYDSVKVSYTIPSNSPWRSTGITASTTDNAIFIRSGKNIYKHPQSTSTPFYTIASDRQFYGKGIDYDPVSKQLLAMTIKGFGQDSKFNDLLFIDPATATLNKKISYEHIYFPAMAMFHP